MNTFVCFPANTEHDYSLGEWNELAPNDRVKVGDPLTIEFKRVKVVSKKFDTFGKSEVMIVNHVKNLQTKERALESITYYDDDAKVKKVKSNSTFSRKQYFSVGPFDASEYGNPVIFHTPGYQGTTIVITTKFWELNSRSTFDAITGTISGILGLASSASPYITIASEAFGITCNIISGSISHHELDTEHTLQLSFRGDKPLVTGLYVCIPNLNDLNFKKEMLRDYFVEDGILATKINDRYVEYTGTYFILQVSNISRDELADFDFTASSSDLLQQLDVSSSTNVKESVLQLSRDAYDMRLIEKLKTTYDTFCANNLEETRLQGVALYKQLAKSDMYDWFNENFGHISTTFG